MSLEEKEETTLNSNEHHYLRSSIEKQNHYDENDYSYEYYIAIIGFMMYGGIIGMVL